MKKLKAGPLPLNENDSYFNPKLAVIDWVTKPFLVQQVAQGIREMERDPDYYGLNELQ